MKWVLIVMAVGASGQPEWHYRTLRHRGEAVMRTLMFALTLACSPAYALDPLDMPKQWPDGPMKEFFQHLMRPDNDSRPQLDERSPLSCCGAGDVVDTKFKVEHGNGPHPDDTWYALINGAWVKIPPEKVVPDFAPDGHAYLFMLTMYGPHGEPYDREIVCFVRPKGGL